MINNILRINEAKKINIKKQQDKKTKKKVCAFLSKKRHNLILKEESLFSLMNNGNFKKYFNLN